MGIPDEISSLIQPISRDLWAYLERKPSDLEIKEVVFGLGPTKAPGPNGVTAEAIQTYWLSLGQLC